MFDMYIACYPYKYHMVYFLFANLYSSLYEEWTEYLIAIYYQKIYKNHANSAAAAQINLHHVVRLRTNTPCSETMYQYTM